MAKEQNKTEIISIRLDAETRDKLAFISELEYRPMALQIRKIIEDFVREYEVEHHLIQEETVDGGWSSGNSEYLSIIEKHAPSPF